MPEREDAAAGGAATGGPCSEPRSKDRNKAVSNGSKRSKAKQAAPKPANQPEEQPAGHMPVEAPTPHRDETACLQQSPAHVELPSKTDAEQSKVQAAVIQDQSPPVQQEGSTDAQAAQKTGQVRKQKAARRKAATKKSADMQTKPSASSSSSPTADSSSRRAQQEQATAAAKIPAEGASPKPVAQPHKIEQTLHRLSSSGLTAPQQAPGLPQVLQQSTPEVVQSIGGSSIGPVPGAAPCGLPKAPNAPNEQPPIARPAPVRLSKSTLQHSQEQPCPL